MDLPINSLLDTVVARHATDLHLEIGKPPTMRVKGVLEPMGPDVLTGEDTTRFMEALLEGGELRGKLESEGCVDFGFGYGTVARFLVTIVQKGTQVGLILRHLLPHPVSPSSCPVCGGEKKKRARK